MLASFAQSFFEAGIISLKKLFLKLLLLLFWFCYRSSFWFWYSWQSSVIILITLENSERWKSLYWEFFSVLLLQFKAMLPDDKKHILHVFLLSYKKPRFLGLTGGFRQKNKKHAKKLDSSSLKTETIL